MNVLLSCVNAFFYCYFDILLLLFYRALSLVPIHRWDWKSFALFYDRHNLIKYISQLFNLSNIDKKLNETNAKRSLEKKIESIFRFISVYSNCV